jgi:aspartate aminotransferase-like enzyme
MRDASALTGSAQFRIPGPTPLPERVRRALAQPMVNHRGAEFKAMLAEIEEGTRAILETRNDVLIFTASGTGGMESAVANLLSPGDAVLLLNTGAFGDRFARILTAFGGEVDQIEMPWGQPVDPGDVEVALRQQPAVRLVFMTHNETSTGVTNDLEAVARVVKAHGRLLVVDAVSSAASLPLKTDAWGVDVVLTGSQKGLMSPPGIALVAISPAAWEHHRSARAPRFYFDWDNQRKAQAEGSAFSTPSITVLYGVREAIRMLLEEGPAAVHARHRRVARGVRAGVEACGLRLYAAESHRSNTVTTVWPPPPLEGEGIPKLLALLRDRYGLLIAGGQGKMAGKLLRIGHLGMVSEEDAVQIVTALESALHDLGVSVTDGRAGHAARDALAQPAPTPSV